MLNVTSFKMLRMPSTQGQQNKHSAQSSKHPSTGSPRPSFSTELYPKMALTVGIWTTMWDSCHLIYLALVMTQVRTTTESYRNGCKQGVPSLVTEWTPSSGLCEILISSSEIKVNKCVCSYCKVLFFFFLTYKPCLSLLNTCLFSNVIPRDWRPWEEWLGL